MIAFVIGLFVGAPIGLLTMALFAARREPEPEQMAEACEVMFSHTLSRN